MHVGLCQLLVLIVLCGSVLPSTGFAQGEHARRAATELRVLRGDLRRLQQSTLSDSEISGLNDRITGNLAVLDILLRLSDNERGREPVSYNSTIEQLQSLWQSRDVANMQRRVADLATAFPLQISLPKASLTSAQTRESRELHNQLCAGCHDNPVQSVERPAYNLFEEVDSQPLDEFVARMLVGVKGDRFTGVDNPLSDAQLTGLIQLYQSQ